MSAALKQRLAAQAQAEGFAAMGICAPDSTPDAAPRLMRFLAEGRHGQMGWMAERTEWRGSAAALWPEAHSVIMLAEPYTPKGDPLEVLSHPDRAAISVYAQGKDYHDLVKRRLKRLGRWLLDQAGQGEAIKVFVDTAPVMEKPLAQAAGLGWQGKHTNLLSRDLGNWFFLGAIFTTLDLPKDAPETSHCGSCTACLDICPTGAFPAPYQLDARRCISYLTIEHKGPVDPDLRALMGNRIYGCDDCQLVCPWNKYARTSPLPDWQPREGLQGSDLAQLLAWDEAQFLRRTEGSAIRRIGHARWLRNLALAAGNALRSVALSPADTQALREALQAHRSHPDPVVQEQVAWSLEMSG